MWEKKANLLKALGEPHRFQALATLSKEELCVGDLARSLGLSPATMSLHLMVLREHKFVTARREFNRVFYKCDSPAVKKMIDVLSQLD